MAAGVVRLVGPRFPFGARGKFIKRQFNCFGAANQPATKRHPLARSQSVHTAGDLLPVLLRQLQTVSWIWIGVAGAAQSYQRRCARMFPLNGFLRVTSPITANL